MTMKNFSSNFSEVETRKVSTQIKTIIFDIDGVLANSREAISYNTKCLMREFGFDVPDARIESMSSAHSAESVLLALAPALSEDRVHLRKMLARLAELTKENITLVKPSLLGVRVPEFAAKYKLAAASNRKTSAHLVLQQLGIAKYFSTVMTSSDAPPKPDPEMIRLALANSGTRAEEAVFVGDNKEDMQAGEGAGVRAIMIDGMDEKACAKFLKEFLG